MGGAEAEKRGAAWSRARGYLAWFVCYALFCTAEPGLTIPRCRVRMRY
jgi:hypothetical protein